MTPFDDLSGSGQVRLLRNAAVSQLRRYGISASAIRLLAHHRQTTFRVECRQTRRRYLLRFHRDGYRPPEEVRSEFRWLRQLGAERDIVTPEPIATTSGEDILQVVADGIPTDLHCSLLRWVEGRRYFRRHGPGRRVVHKVGRIMATMHTLAEAFAPPKGFTCPVWNWERLFRYRRSVSDKRAIRRLPPADRRLFAKVERQVQAAMDNLGSSRKVLGVIHGDLMQANYLIHRAQVRIIDFADFGVGYFLYDMAITLFALWGLDPGDRQRQAFLTGYREARSLSLDHERLLDVFIAGRGVVQARFVLASEFPDDRAMAPKYVSRVIDGLKHWLR